jgi:hypothetical protein
MPGMQTRTRQQAIVSFQANSQVQSQQLGLGMLYRELYLNLQGTITSNNSNPVFTPSTLLAGDEWGVVQRIDVLVNGADNIASFTGEELGIWNAFMLGRPRDLTLANAAGTVNFDQHLILPFWDKTSYTPIDSLLNSARLSDLRVNITWGSATSVSNNTGATFTVAPTLTIASRECFGIQGDFSTWRRFRMVDNNVAANQQYEVRLPLGNVYRGFLINTKTAAGVDLADCIDRVKLISGTNVYFDLDYSTLQRTSRANNARPPIIVNQNQNDTTNINTRLLSIALSSSADLRGWAMLDLVDDGYLTEAIDTVALSELKLQFVTNQSIGSFTVLPSQIIPVRKPSTAAA